MIHIGIIQILNVYLSPSSVDRPLSPSYAKHPGMYGVPHPGDRAAYYLNADVMDKPAGPYGSKCYDSQLYPGMTAGGAIPTYTNSDVHGGFASGYDVGGRCVQFQSYMEPQYFGHAVSRQSDAKPALSWPTSAYHEDPEASRKDDNINSTSGDLHPVISIMPLASSPDCLSQSSSSKANLLSPDRHTHPEFCWQGNPAEPTNKKRRLEDDVCTSASAQGHAQSHSSPEQTVPDKHHVTSASPGQNARGLYFPPVIPTYSTSSLIQNDPYSNNPYLGGGYQGFGHPETKEQQCLSGVGATY